MHDPGKDKLEKSAPRQAGIAHEVSPQVISTMGSALCTSSLTAAVSPSNAKRLRPSISERSLFCHHDKPNPSIERNLDMQGCGF